MSDFTELKLYSNGDNSDIAHIEIRVRQLNPAEYKELFEAARTLQKICDKYIVGAPVLRPDEAIDE